MQFPKNDKFEGEVISEDLSNDTELTKVRVHNQTNAKLFVPFEYITSTEFSPGLVCSCGDKACEQNRSNIVRPATYFQVFYANPVKKWAIQTLAPIKDGTPIFEYTGVLSKVDEQHSTAEVKQNDDYIIGFTHNGQAYMLDAYRKGNLARFINHSCRPNCRAMLATIEDGDQHIPRVLIYTTRDLKAGEELSMHYGQQWWEAKSGTVFCLCNSQICKYGKKSGSQMDDESIQMFKDCAIATKTVDVDDHGCSELEEEDNNAIATKSTADGKVIAIKTTTADGKMIATKTIDGPMLATKSTADGKVIAIKTTTGGSVIATKTADGQVIAVINGGDARGTTTSIKLVNGRAIATKFADGTTTATAQVVVKEVAVKSVDEMIINKCMMGKRATAKKSVQAASAQDGQPCAAKSVAGACSLATKAVAGRADAVKTVDG